MFLSKRKQISLVIREGPQFYANNTAWVPMVFALDDGMISYLNVSKRIHDIASCIMSDVPTTRAVEISYSVRPQKSSCDHEHYVP